MDTATHQLNIGQLLATPLANTPEEEIIHGDRRMSYRSLRDRIGRLASALAGLGIGPGSVVAVMDWDSHRYLECFFAVPMMGAVLHTVNVRLSPEQILYTINHAQDDAILIHRDFLPVLATIRDRIARPVTLILLQDGDGEMPEGFAFSGEYEAMLSLADPAFRFPEFSENTLATLFYTTGTTGEPKGVTFTHRQIVLHTLGVIAALGPVPGRGGLHREDVYMPLTPLFHVHAWGMPYVATVLGLRQVYPGRFEPAKALALIARHGVTFSHCVPAILNMVLNAPGSAETDLSRWKVIIGGSAFPAGLAEAALKRGIDAHAGYGMSETCPILTIADMVASQRPEGGVEVRVATGKAVPLVELRLADDEGRPVAHDGAASGEVTARAPWLTEAYLRNPEGTAKLWRDGWLRTGDVGSIGPNGTLRIGDRLKDVIKSGGEWVSSLDLESIASRVPGVAEAAAIGLPDDRWGERPCLVVVAAAGAEGGVVAEGCREAIGKVIAEGRLPKWAAPDRVEIVEAIPKTSVGKLDKKRMRAEFGAPRS